MTRATHFSYVIITLVTAVLALVPPQHVHKAEHVVRNIERRQIPAEQREMLLAAAAAGLKLVHAAPAAPQKRQAENQLCVQDDMLSRYQNDPDATSLCSALINEVPMTSTVMTSTVT